jgi:hypothetical protein
MDYIEVGEKCNFTSYNIAALPTHSVNEFGEKIKKIKKIKIRKISSDLFDRGSFKRS